ncbi:MAG: GTP pyrophosphokinase family protein [Clostridia bacterium]
MNLKNRLILEDYRKQRDDFVKLGDVVHNMLTDIVSELGITVLGIEHRVKAEKSLAGKLERNGDWYSQFEDLTDILGARVICFFSDEIDKIGKKVEESFVIDWENSSDKRALIKADTFGYLSLHYICSLPFGDKWPDEICGKRFEIQIRTTLQHTWAAINHDLGYKSQFGVPREVSRQFARIAGLLEIADDEFVRVRNNMKNYTEDIRQKIIENKADDVHIDMISLNEYVKRNVRMQELISHIAKISNAEISEIDPESYIVQLKFLGKETLGDLQNMLEENRCLAVKLAEKSLANADLDILSSSVGLRFLCRAELLNKNCSQETITEFLKLSMGTEEKAQRQAKHLLRTYEKVKEECE